MSDTEKKPRVMSAKGFLHKSNSAKVSASAFLLAHREWLTTGDLGNVTTPILVKLETDKAELIAAKKDTEIVAAVALEEIRVVVLNHMLVKSITEAEDKLKEQAERVARGESPTPSKPRVPKSWEASIYNAKGEMQFRANSSTGELEELSKGFDSSSDADGWVDRRLFEGASDWYSEIVSTKIISQKTGLALKQTILRDDAIARILRKPKGAAMHKSAKSTNSLGFGVKAKQDRASFSRG